MLLERLVEEASQAPKYDWDSYYRWLLSSLAGREATGYRFWLCRHCLTVNFHYLPERYAKCRRCDLIHLPSAPEE